MIKDENILDARKNCEAIKLVHPLLLIKNV